MTAPIAWNDPRAHAVVLEYEEAALAAKDADERLKKATQAVTVHFDLPDSFWGHQFVDGYVRAWQHWLSSTRAKGEA